MKLIKKQVVSPEETAIILEYMEWSRELEEIYDYLQGKHRQITGYGQNHEMFQIRLDSILYFEAVGGLVFAYTEEQVYEIKMRLYQIEEFVKQNQMMRAAKSLVINVGKIVSLRPALNGKLLARMSNGEEVQISRQYAKKVTESMMSA